MFGKEVLGIRLCTLRYRIGIGISNSLSTEYIHFSANSIARRLLIILASGSIRMIRSAEIATSEKLLMRVFLLFRHPACRRHPRSHTDRQIRYPVNGIPCEVSG